MSWVDMGYDMVVDMGLIWVSWVEMGYDMVVDMGLI